ncbi:hypothetical protein GCM10007049_10470 [Echinicola pacifica]|uniref:histidine kinase n=1 Tax=Echinicola pacifica TaxID=346377 RepID=A0A918UM48_9BACT|nr:PAS domain-containing protein [Echinicola pacifica]GGZ19823.1 hypothetical protein GCM10007049_10470 [Echinicola pacifica]
MENYKSISGLLNLEKASSKDYQILFVSSQFQEFITIFTALDLSNALLCYEDKVLDRFWESFETSSQVESYLLCDNGTIIYCAIEGNIIRQANGNEILSMCFNFDLGISDGLPQWLYDQNKEIIYPYIGNKFSKKHHSLVDFAKFFQQLYPSNDLMSIESFLQEDKHQKILIKSNTNLQLQKESLPQAGFVKLKVMDGLFEQNLDAFLNWNHELIGGLGREALFYEYHTGRDTIKLSGPLFKLMGFPLHNHTEIPAQDWYDLIYEGDKVVYQRNFQKSLNSTRPLVSYYHLKQKSGSLLFVREDTVSFHDSTSGKIYLFGTIRKVSDEKPNYEGDQIVTNDFENHLPGMVFSFTTNVDGEQEFTFISREVRKIFEVDDHTTMKSEDLMQRIHPDDYHLILAANKKLHENPQVTVTFRIINSQNQIKYLFCTCRLTDRYSKSWSGYMIDITYFRQLQQEVNEFPAYQRVSFDNSPQVIFQFDKEGTIIKANQTLFQKTQSENKTDYIGKSIHDIYKHNPVYPCLLEGLKYGYARYEGPFVSYLNSRNYFVNLTVKKLSLDNVFEASFEDITYKEYVQRILNDTAEISAHYNDQQFFDELVKLLSFKLNISFCIIGDYLEDEESVKTIAVSKNGGLIPNFIYTLKNTPCDRSLNSKSDGVTIIADHVADLFPKDLFLQDEKLKSYCSTAIKNKAGKKVGILVLADTKPMLNESGIINIVSILADRVGAELQRMRYEQELVSSQQLYRSIAENFPKGTVDVLDRELRYIYTEGSEYFHLGLDPKALIGTKHLSKYDEFTARRAKLKLEEIFQGQTVTYEITFNDQNYMKIGVPLRDEDGKVTRALLVTQNITVTKKAQIERERLIRDLSSHNEELQRFAYIVSHNLRAPIVNITSLLDLINEDNLADPTNLELIDSLKTSTQILNATLMDLIEVVSIKKQKLLKVENISFHNVVHNIEKSLFRQLQDAKAIINRDFQVEHINYVYSHLENFLLNFVTNSIKYSHPDRQPILNISTEQVGKNILITFNDNGIGIDLEKYGDRIFGLYQRFHTHVEGKGLGLYLIREQIRSLDGDILVESSVDIGTTFRIILKNLPLSKGSTQAVGQTN